MTILAHVFARRCRARLVQVFASRTIATNNGGSQPQIAIAVGQARDRLPSVLVLDELDMLASADVRDADKRRAANDLISESLRAVYGPSHVVMGVYTTYGDDKPTRALQQRFEHVVCIDVPELERAMLITAVNTADDALFRSMPITRLAERADVHREWDNAA
ncbi:MAG: ATP-binding protein [Actinobacteria bacterium]|nr:ATP-binding protein [Actinomycetota bacterium]